VTKQPDPQQGFAYNPDYGTVLPAMTGNTPVNGETFRVNIPAGARVGYAYAGPVNGSLGSTAFSSAQGTFKSKTEFEVTAIWDKSKQLVNIAYPITVTMNPR
jgi:hypothetical protein